jgi:hypothetical protein
MGNRDTEKKKQQRVRKAQREQDAAMTDAFLRNGFYGVRSLIVKQFRRRGEELWQPTIDRATLQFIKSLPGEIRDQREAVLAQRNTPPLTRERLRAIEAMREAAGLPIAYVERGA